MEYENGSQIGKRQIKYGLKSEQVNMNKNY
jgi:hypothetical protein